jgi:hypothetical protein
MPNYTNPDVLARESSTESAGTTPSEDKPLVARASTLSLILAVVLFAGNIAAAWFVAAQANALIGRTLLEKNSYIDQALQRGSQLSANDHLLMNRRLDAELLLRSIQNRHIITVVGMGAAFALVAVGFALFVMGAEGAFTLQGAIQDRGNLVIKSTAPGVLCFFLAAIIVCFVVAAKTDMRPVEYHIFPDGPAGAESHPVAPAGDTQLPSRPTSWETKK